MPAISLHSFFFATLVLSLTTALPATTPRSPRPAEIPSNSHAAACEWTRRFDNADIDCHHSIDPTQKTHYTLLISPSHTPTSPSSMSTFCDTLESNIRNHCSNHVYFTCNNYLPYKRYNPFTKRVPSASGAEVIFTLSKSSTKEEDVKCVGEAMRMAMCSTSAFGECVPGEGMKGAWGTEEEGMELR
ncbi:hypothetical protein M011DRAFT_457806 [Sporormia fimetaria CBS 119925]|uniref:Uncharacterized protein n=1 Tax=Sporormia fimetaria CBS 119925 TaxID=1340428 RepID=A0A6A6VD48_9PLEO|nr:hypothetical protein M011DRAFT_457806 [Sporormia fimetaria CBS 119925]